MVLNFEREDAEEKEEEGEVIRRRRSHPAPSKAERDAHARTHIPYRSWCKHCVAARGPATQRRGRRDDEEREGPQVAVDYCLCATRKGRQTYQCW